MTTFVAYFLLLLLTIITCALTHFPVSVMAVTFLFIYTLIREKPALKRLVRIPILIFILLIFASALLTPSFMGTSDMSSPVARLLLGIDLLAKALMLLLVIQIFATRISVAQLTRVTEKLGLKGFGFVLGIALHLLPALHRHARASRRAMLIRGAFRQNRIQAEFRWIMAIMRWMLRQGDLICVSARLRGVVISKQK